MCVLCSLAKGEEKKFLFSLFYRIFVTFLRLSFLFPFAWSSACVFLVCFLVIVRNYHVNVFIIGLYFSSFNIFSLQFLLFDIIREGVSVFREIFEKTVWISKEFFDENRVIGPCKDRNSESF